MVCLHRKHIKCLKLMTHDRSSLSMQNRLQLRVLLKCKVLTGGEDLVACVTAICVIVLAAKGGIVRRVNCLGFQRWHGLPIKKENSIVATSV